jgi:hypothetical protein
MAAYAAYRRVGEPWGKVEQDVGVEMHVCVGEDDDVRLAPVD